MGLRPNIHHSSRDGQYHRAHRVPLGRGEREAQAVCDTECHWGQGGGEGGRHRQCVTGSLGALSATEEVEGRALGLCM